MTGVDLTQIDGLDSLTVQDILSEIGTGVSPWPTVKHFVSWLRLSPNNKVTGGKVNQRGTQPSMNRVKTAFRVAAQSLARSDCALVYKRKTYSELNKRFATPCPPEALSSKTALWAACGISG